MLNSLYFDRCRVASQSDRGPTVHRMHAWHARTSHGTPEGTGISGRCCGRARWPVCRNTKSLNSRTQSITAPRKTCTHTPTAMDCCGDRRNAPRFRQPRHTKASDDTKPMESALTAAKGEVSSTRPWRRAQTEVASAGHPSRFPLAIGVWPSRT